MSWTLSSRRSATTSPTKRSPEMLKRWPVCRVCRWCKDPFFTLDLREYFCDNICRGKSDAEKVKAAEEKKREAKRKRDLTGKHCIVCGSCMPVWRKAYCTPCSLALMAVKRKDMEDKKMFAQGSHRTSKAIYRENQKNLAAIGKAALEMFPHLKELLK